jgi:hypothetical protein
MVNTLGNLRFWRSISRPAEHCGLSPGRPHTVSIFYSSPPLQPIKSGRRPCMQFNNEILKKLRNLWVYYLLQSALAAGVLAVLFWILGETQMVLVSAIGSSAFVVFAMPKTCSARAKVVIGSHIIGLISGAVFAFTSFPHFIEYPMAIGIAIFLMVALDLEHPPAAGTAIATVTYGTSLDIWATIIVSVFFLSLARHLLKKYLRNLV